MRPIDGSPPCSPVPGILQARTLEWVAISFSNAWKWKVKVKSLSCVRLSATPWTAAYQAPPSMWFSSQDYWSGVPLPSLSNHLSLLKFWSFYLHIKILGVCWRSPSLHYCTENAFWQKSYLIHCPFFRVPICVLLVVKYLKLQGVKNCIACVTIILRKWDMYVCVCLYYTLQQCNTLL